MNPQRPDPDALLRRVHAEEARQSEGKLKVFFGANPGVGKTYAMLEAAHEQRRDGADVIVGVVETHGRAETEALVQGLEILPRRTVEYRTARLQEFDLDAALARRPSLILMDELAHTNAPGLRHAKRWQDVQELLKSGIHVYTTVNVQHLEGLNDVVAQITGVRVRETVPDSVLERADDVELVDLPPDDLLQRLKDGKVYVPEQIQHAIQHFFTKGNLIALRELALRRTAERVDQQMEVYRRDHAVVRTWPAAETIMVCVNMKPRGPRLIRAARQMAADLHAKWIAVYVQIPRHLQLPQEERDRLVHTLRLAEQLGAETVTVTGENVAQELLNYARSRNATKIIVGKPVRSPWKEWMFGSVVSELVHQSGDIDIYVITGEAGEGKPLVRHSLRRTSRMSGYAYASVGVVTTTAVAWLMFPYFAQANLIMMYLIAIIVIAIRCGRGPSVLASVLSVASFDFFFVPPYFTFAVSDAQYLLTFGVMLVVALVISNLAVRIRQQADLARYRERRTGVLYTMSRDLATHRGTGMLCQLSAKHLREVFDAQVAIFLADADKRVQLQRGEQLYFEFDPKESGVAQWVFEHTEAAGLGTDTLPGASALYIPLVGSSGAIGVVAVRPTDPSRLLDPDQWHLLESLVNQVALAIERTRLSEEAQRAHVRAETERMRNAILSSVSHDLRTPLATISGAASTLMDEQRTVDSTVRAELSRSIYREADRLDRLLKNLVEMMRIEAGAGHLHRDWHPLDEIVGSALATLERRMSNHPVHAVLPADLPLVFVDGVLLEQVVINLVENALKYGAPGSPIDLSATVKTGEMIVEIADHGPGIPAGEEARIFDKFYRGTSAREGGVGLGLTICRGIIDAHGGRISADNRPGGGAVFRFTLPISQEQPPVRAEQVEAGS
ncbi:two-component sensor histidine kinase [Nitrospira sp. KM1]|uniref:sensor histidine kinase n=1 Tax=Nitrospira sp. KM1 TaxID=1936990 RepID=UPI0013A72AF2|nr:sensor histidine kinase KdpD [Nitrospira sp. KM1]BCA56352.1 two-component sensor histidine kinase [Nitrospira sp. KM1]